MAKKLKNRKAGLKTEPGPLTLWGNISQIFVLFCQVSFGTMGIFLAEKSYHVYRKIKWVWVQSWFVLYFMLLKNIFYKLCKR